MYRMLLSRLTSTFILLFVALLGYAQTTVTSLSTAATTTSSPGAVTFAVKNNNAFPVAVTQVATFHNTANNNRIYTVWYHPTALTGAPTISTANGWVQLGISSAITASANGLVTILTNKYLVMQSNATYRFAITINTGSMYYSNTGTTTYSAGGVDILTGANVTSPSYAGTSPSPTTSANVYFAGSVTFTTASVNNVGATVVTSPANNAQFCYNAPILIKAAIFNNGGSAQTNFPVSATYVSSSASNTISTTYTGTIAPFTSDTVVIGTIIPTTSGSYTIRARTQLSTDTIKVNDTTPSISFTVKPIINPPVVISDTACPGDNAFLTVQPVASTVYRWYSAQTGGVLVNIGNNLSFNPLTQDTIMYISAQFNGCESERTKITGIIGTAPIIDFGPDTSFCESIPLVLDAGNPGAKYLWSTGDTTQTITVTNQSGNYAVIVNRYCAVSDTINVSIAPLPIVSGISYIRNGNLYQFNASSVQNVDSYLWIFGDGGTSTSPNPTHFYGSGINVALTVKLVVYNSCGTDTAFRSVPTGIDDAPANDKNVRIYPNPATEQIHIGTESSLIEQVQVISLTGAVIMDQKANHNKDVIMDVRNIVPGNYILRVRTTNGEIKQPLQIIR